MKTYICTEKCTFGKPPRLYVPGDVLLSDLDKAPRHFKAGVVAKAEPVAVEEAGKTLAEAGAKPVADAAAALAAKTAPEACTVGELAAKLGVDAAVIKEASGKSKINEKLTSDEVSAVMAAVQKAGVSGQASEDGEAKPEAGE